VGYGLQDFIRQCQEVHDIHLVLWKLFLKNILATNLALLLLEEDLPVAAAEGQDFCLPWGSVGNKQFSPLYFLLEEKQLANLCDMGHEMR